MLRRAFRPAKHLAVMAVSTVATLALVGVIGGPATEWSARAASYAVRPVAAIAQLPSTIGIAEGHDFYLMGQAEIDRTLDAMQALGVQNVRVGIFWADIEAEEGVFKWDNVDRMVEAATLRGMGILGTILYTPRWAGATQSPEYTEWTSHPDPVKFGNFVGAVAEKYAGRISSYEIWNEPTADLFFDPVDPAVYTQLLQQGYRAVKAVDPSAVVIAGSVVAGPTREDGSTMSPVDFLQGMYDAGAKGYFDAFSYHPYLYTMSFSQGQNQPHFDYPIEQLDEIRALMVTKGDGNLKVWITEYGQPTNTTHQNIYLTEEQQAAFIEDLLRTWQGIDGAGPVFIYQTRDTATDSADPDKNFGLYDHEWDPKLAASVLADLIEEFTPAQNPNPSSPLRALLQQVAHAISQVLNFVPNMITKVIRTMVNFIGSILGTNPPNAAAAPAVARAAVTLEPESSEPLSPVDSARSMTTADLTAHTENYEDHEASTDLELFNSPEPESRSTTLHADVALDELPVPDNGEMLDDQKPAEEGVTPDLDGTEVSTEPEDSSVEESVKEATKPKDSKDSKDTAPEPANPDSDRTKTAPGDDVTD